MLKKMGLKNKIFRAGVCNKSNSTILPFHANPAVFISVEMLESTIAFDKCVKHKSELLSVEIFCFCFFFVQDWFGNKTKESFMDLLTSLHAPLHENQILYAINVNIGHE